MIIMDMNQISLASLMMHLNMEKTNIVDEGIVRHMILNSVRMYRTMFNEEYGEIVLAYDSKHYWRREVFPNYKANRRKGREKDNKDWDAIFSCLNKIKAELKENFPYKHLEIYGAEADDIIATLVKKYPNQKVMIVSGDKDFIQLQKHENVSQYSPITKKYINGVDAYDYIKTHILKGDTSDGVPKVLSNDNTFVDGLRQRPLSQTKINTWKEGNINNFEVERNYQRNKKLIDLDEIPNELSKQIIEEFESAPCEDRSKLLDYFIHNKLKELTDSIGEF